MKKLSFLIFSLLCLAVAGTAQNVAVNTDGSTADTSAMLDVKSTNKGMLVPRMSTVQRTAIASPATGLLVYDTDTKSFWYYNGAAWTSVAGAGSGGRLSLPYDTTANISGTAFRIANGSTAIEGSSTSGSGVYGYSEDGSGVNASSAKSFGILASSSQSTAIYAFNNNPANILPAIRASNTGGGTGMHASSTTSHGVLGTTSAISKAGVRGEASVNGSDGVYGLNTANGVGVRGESITGTGVIGYSTSGTGLASSSISGTGVYAGSISGLALNVNGNLRISGGNTSPAKGAVLTSDALGNAHWENNSIAFRTYGVSSALTNGIPNNTFPDAQSKKVEFVTQSYDLNNNFTPTGNSAASATSSTFLVPKNGIYHFDASVTTEINYVISYTSIGVSLVLSRNGVVSHLASTTETPDHTYGGSVSISTDVSLLAGDRVWVEFQQINFPAEVDNNLATSGVYNFFSGRLVIPQ